MKELSIEEKAKRYDEALKFARIYYTSGDEDMKMMMKTCFPVLVEESEDEKIRKEIIDYLSTVDDKELIPYESWIAWLEKQDEQKPADTEKGAKGNDREIPNSDWSDEDEAIYYGVIETEQYMLDVVNGIKKFDVGNISIKEECTRELNWLKALKNRVQPQPKQEWSEDDENNFKHLMDEIVCLGNRRNSVNRLYYDRLIKFLDELKNRIQPREEWCDKDERMLDRLIAYFEKRVAFTDDDNPRYANWLKSLRPQNTWKPSDEQIRELSIVSTGKGWFSKETLSGLLEQLKKLKG